MSTNLGSIYTGSKNDRIRSCIYVDKNIDSTLFPRVSFRNISTVIAEISNKIIIIVSAFLPYDSHEMPSGDLMGDIVKNFQKEQIMILVGCDSNIHLTSYLLA